MDIPIHTLIGWAVTLFTLAGGWYTMKFRVDSNTDQLNETKRQLEVLWNWKDAHEKETADKRLEIQKQFGGLESRIDGHDGNYRRILEILAEIKDDLKGLKGNR